MIPKLLFHFLTSPRRGAGTTASVRIWLLETSHGTRLGPFAWIHGGFPTGSTRIVPIELPDDNNDMINSPPNTVGVEHNGAIGDVGSGWFLERVVISPVNKPDVAWSFECFKWLGEADYGSRETGGPTRIELKNPIKGNLATLLLSSTNHHLPSPQSSPPLTTITSSGGCTPCLSHIQKGGKKAHIGPHGGHAGQDAYFISQDGTRFGVADGVSQWNEIGVDSGLFAQALCQGALQTGTMEGAFAATRGIRGSSTLTIVNVDLNKSIAKVDVLGDSRVALIRGGKMIESTSEQEHAFGVPFQLSSEPKSDSPAHAMHEEWNLEHGDFIVAATDGMFDNLEDDEIAAIVTKAKSPRDAAQALITSAWLASQRASGETPYSRAASEAFDLIFRGGKKDDVSCVVARV